MMNQKQARVGNGFDVHQFEDGDGVILCGTKIPYSKKLKGHSDADCAWHALTDALLGAIGLGDIGEHFPDNDAQWKGADSGIFLKKAVEEVSRRTGQISNIDITIICEEPKMKLHKKQMRELTAKILAIEPDRVNIKATTTEKLGFLGRKEGLAAMATATILI
jgi:2-C-methyl-D-erythritol 4-phosphate cytidylyltransferase/2-C-methyl-D-erythritol 2,4-cyclodiphosphate synthase